MWPAFSKRKRAVSTYSLWPMMSSTRSSAVSLMKLSSSMSIGPSTQWTTPPQLKSPEMQFWSSWNNTRSKLSSLTFRRLWRLLKRKNNKRKKSRRSKSIFWVLKPRKTRTSPNGIQTLSSSPACLITMIFQAVTFWDHGHFPFGKSSQLSWMLSLSQTEQKTLISQCSFQDQSLRSRRNTLRDFHQKSLGSPSQASLIWPSQSLSDQPVRQSCIQLMLTGSRVTEIYPWNLTSGLTSSDGNSSIQPHSSELVSSFGKKAIQPMLPSNRPKSKCTQTLSFTPKLTKRFWLYQSSRVSRLSQKDSQEVTVLPLFRPGFMRMVEPSKLLPVTI